MPCVYFHEWSYPDDWPEHITRTIDQYLAVILDPERTVYYGWSIEQSAWIMTYLYRVYVSDDYECQSCQEWHRKEEKGLDHRLIVNQPLPLNIADLIRLQNIWNRKWVQAAVQIRYHAPTKAWFCVLEDLYLLDGFVSHWVTPTSIPSTPFRIDPALWVWEGTISSARFLCDITPPEHRLPSAPTSRCWYLGWNEKQSSEMSLYRTALHRQGPIFYVELCSSPGLIAVSSVSIANLPKAKLWAHPSVFFQPPS